MAASFNHVRLVGVCIIKNLGLGLGMHRVRRFVVPNKPVMVNIALFLWDASDDNRCLWGAESVVVDFDRRAGDVCAVVAVKSPFVTVRVYPAPPPMGPRSSALAP